jgi:hypothetical protein
MVGDMVDFSTVGRAQVLSALEEYDRLGSGAFLSRHGFGRARDYVLVHDQKEYDSQAVLGVAHRYAVGRVAGSEEFSAGRDGAAKVLADLGFVVEFRGADAPGDEHPVDASLIGAEQARAGWAIAAREELCETARHYHSVTTYKELSSAVMRTTGVTTKQLVHYWIGDVLGRVSADCSRRGEPLLSSLCVNAEGSVGEGYAIAVVEARGSRPEDPDQHAASERLDCYRHFGADLPPGGGLAALTPKLKSSRDRARRARRAEQVAPVCPTCHMELPGTRVCNYCD